MKKIFLLISAFSLFYGGAFAEENDSYTDRVGTNGHSSLLKEQGFVAETDRDSVADSLNRISGSIDLGFATPEQTYKSTAQYRPGPFGRQEQQNSTY